MLISKVLDNSHIILPGGFFKGKSRSTHGYMYEQYQICNEQYFRNGPKTLHSLVRTADIVFTQDVFIDA